MHGGKKYWYQRLLPNSKFFVVLKEESRIGGIPQIDQ
jgi:hypothetical protein